MKNMKVLLFENEKRKNSTCRQTLVSGRFTFLPSTELRASYIRSQLGPWLLIDGTYWAAVRSVVYGQPALPVQVT